MGVVTIDEKTYEVPAEVAKFVEDLTNDYRSALKSAQKAEERVRMAEASAAAAVRAGEAKVRTEGARIIGWVEARAHSFFLTADGDFHNVSAFLKHMAAGLEQHLQPATLSAAAAAPSTSAAAVQVSTTGIVPTAPAKPAGSPAEPSTPAPGE